ncbi:hypothetical protein ACFLT4_04090 [Chloroflexota bacterium]
MSIFVVGILTGGFLGLLIGLLDTGKTGDIIMIAFFAIFFGGLGIWGVNEAKKKSKCVRCGTPDTAQGICAECLNYFEQLEDE